MKRWNILSADDFKKNNLTLTSLLTLLLKNRGLTTKKTINTFLHPKLSDISPASVGIDEKELKKAIERIKKAITEKEHMVVFGDYDVDGICGTAILWETLHSLGAHVTPYIPHRIDEGYGLSVKGVTNLLAENTDVGLIITVDNGIVAQKATQTAKKRGVDVIITDHHVPAEKKPNAFAIVHTTNLCGAGVAYLLRQALCSHLKMKGNGEDEYLELVALATVADLVPLVGANRTLTIYGLESLKNTKRAGLLALMKEAGLDAKAIDIYSIGHIIAPRLNAMGRLESAMDSLRLLCTTNQNRAQLLAIKLNNTNKERQQLTIDAVLHAKTFIHKNNSSKNKLLFIADSSYQQGVIGLIAGKLVEEYYRPSIVVSIGDLYSKASARSIHGFNMIEFIRTAIDLLVDVGGHPMAAGFTIETQKLPFLQTHLENLADNMLDSEKLKRVLRIDCELPFSFITKEVYIAIQKLSPFGMNNPEPIFMSKRVVIEDMKLVGLEKRHVKMKLNQKSIEFEAIGFGLAEITKGLHIGEAVNIAYTVSVDNWNGNSRLQLKIKDIQKYSSE